MALINADLKGFGGRIRVLMEESEISGPVELANRLLKLYPALLQPQPRKRPVKSENTQLRTREDKDIVAIRRMIQRHMNEESAENIPGNYMIAYSGFFGVSTDYLYGLTNIKSPDTSVQAICKKTGLTEEAVLRLVRKDAPDIEIEELERYMNPAIEDFLLSEFYIQWPKTFRDLHDLAVDIKYKKIKVEAFEEEFKASDAVFNYFESEWRIQRGELLEMIDNYEGIVARIGRKVQNHFDFEVTEAVDKTFSDDYVLERKNSFKNNIRSLTASYIAENSEESSSEKS